jgi:hypothetical protein
MAATLMKWMVLEVHIVPGAYARCNFYLVHCNIKRQESCVFAEIDPR